MKKESRFIVLFMILGALTGLSIGLILTAIAVPSYGNYILTLKEKADFEHLGNIGNWVPAAPIVWMLFLVLGTFAFALFLSALNPHIKGAFRNKTSFPKALTVVIASFVFTCIVGYLANIEQLIFLPLVLSISWLVAGELGLAGDYSSWKMGANAKPVEAFLLGGVTGAVMWGVIRFFEWGGSKYFFLVSEVWDGSGETTWLGFMLLGGGLVAVFMVGMGIFASLTLALSPTYRTAKERLIRLIFPSVLIGGSCLLVTITYQIASAKYNLNKGTLAAAIGIPDKASVYRTVILLKSTDVKPEAWPLETKVDSGFFPAGNVEISYENLKRAEDYLRNHPDGSVFNYAAKEMLASGYYALWDVKNGLEQQFKASEDMLLPRVVLVSKLPYLPTTEINLNYLKSFSDEGKWYVGPKYSLKIADAYRHFGMMEEAKKWFEKGKAGRADTSKTRPMSGPVLTDGSIKGKITIEGKHPPDIMIGLIQDDGSLKALGGGGILFAKKLIDAQPLDPAGGFSFERLGESEYLLAIMTDEKTVPSASDVKVVNSPGSIKLTADKGAQRVKDINIFVSAVPAGTVLLNKKSDDTAKSHK